MVCRRGAVSPNSRSQLNKVWWPTSAVLFGGSVLLQNFFDGARFPGLACLAAEGLDYFIKVELLAFGKRLLKVSRERRLTPNLVIGALVSSRFFAVLGSVAARFFTLRSAAGFEASVAAALVEAGGGSLLVSKGRVNVGPGRIRRHAKGSPEFFREGVHADQRFLLRTRLPVRLKFLLEASVLRLFWHELS